MVAWYRSADRAARHALLRMSICAKDAKTCTATFAGNGLHYHGKGSMLTLRVLSWAIHFWFYVDACSKWPEVFSMTSTTTAQTVMVLRELFTRTGVPAQLVSDNGPQFIHEGFQIFLRNNGIKHVTSVSYHPATNDVLLTRFGRNRCR